MKNSKAMRSPGNKAQRRSTWQAKYLLGVTAVIVTFLALELATRTYDVVRGRGFFSNTRTIEKRELLPFRMFGFELYGTKNGILHISSRHGEPFPLKKSPGTFRIVVFGGSTTENLVAYQQAGVHYPLLLQEKLRERLHRDDIEVINVGNSAYSTVQSLILLELDVVSWQPDMIIVSHNVNDLLSSYWPDFTYDYSHKYSNEYYLPDFKTKYATHNRVLRHSQFYCAMKSRFDGFRNTRPTEIHRKSQGDALSPDAIEVFERNLRSIASIAKANDIDVVFGSQPLFEEEAFFEKHMSLKRYNSEVVYPLHKQFLQHHQSLNEAIARVATDTECDFVDCHAAVTNRESFVDFVHYTPVGVDELAAEYAEYLVENDLVK